MATSCQATMLPLAARTWGHRAGSGCTTVTASSGRSIAGGAASRTPQPAWNAVAARATVASRRRNGGGPGVAPSGRGRGGFGWGRDCGISWRAPGAMCGQWFALRPSQHAGMGLEQTAPQPPSPADEGLVDALVTTSFVTMAVISRVGAAHELSLSMVRMLGILWDRRPRMTELA